MPQLEEDIKFMLIPSDPADEKDIIVEIRAGAGGDEAAIFAGDLYNMYTRFASDQGWKCETMDMHASEAGGFKEISFKMLGDRVYSIMKFESGVHRVQRVPKTESQGRIHTSTATVAVLPEADEVEVEIQSERLAHRCVSCGRPRWSVCQHDRLGSAHHASAYGLGRSIAGSEVAVAEQDRRYERASRAPL